MSSRNLFSLPEIAAVSAKAEARNFLVMLFPFVII
jgi:hypothetical protein